MSGTLDDFDFGAILSKPTQRVGQTLKGRKAVERKKLSEADRRRLATTGRTEQLNLKLRAFTKVEFIQRAQLEGIMQVELFEKAWDRYKTSTEGV